MLQKYFVYKNPPNIGVEITSNELKTYTDIAKLVMGS